MSFLQSILIYFVSPLLSLLLIIFFVYMVFSWLIAFNIVNLRNPAMAQIYELNIGHAIVARALFDGLDKAVRDMKALMVAAR